MEIILRNVRVSFVEVFDAVTFKESTSYGIKCFIEPGSENDKAIRKAIEEVGLIRFPQAGKWERVHDELRLDKKAYPYIDGKRVDYVVPDGNWILTAKRAEKDGRPMVIDGRKNPLAKSDGKPYSGCYCNVKVDLWAQDGENKGVRCTLQVVQFVKDGDSFGGAKPPSADDMDDLGDTGGDDLAGGSSLAGGDDDLC